MRAAIGRRQALRAVAAGLVVPWGARRARAAGEQPLRIGLMTDLSSWGKDNGGSGSVYACRAAVRELGGTAAGRPVEVLVGDHKMTPDVGMAIARRWFDEEGVHAIADVPNSAIALAVMDLAKQKDRIALFSGPGSSEITNTHCNDRTVQYTYDTYAIAKVAASALMAQGARTWFFVTADYAFGKQLQRDATGFIEQAGGRVLGAALHPPGTTDFSALLLQAQGSRADVVAFANTGTDCTNCFKQANEFGLARQGQRLTGLSMFLTDIHAAELAVTQGAAMTVASYWAMTPETRAWSKGYYAEVGLMPTMLQSGVYGVVRHYLRAVQASGTADSAAVMQAMRQVPIEDIFARGATLREDGRVVRDILARVKTPAESKEPWDYLDIVRTVPGRDAYRPLADSACSLVRKT